MKKEYILFFDSGNGGRYVLDVFKMIVPNENLLLYKDSKNCPYGNKDKYILKKIIDKSLDKLLKVYNIKLVVIACNTLSSTLKTHLKYRYKKYKFFFVEPFINNKILLDKTLLIATNNTILHNKQVNKFKTNKNLYIKGFSDLAKKIDNCQDNYDSLLNFLQASLNQYKKYQIKNIVLGCTHFNYIKKQLLSIFPNAIFFEKSAIIAKEVKNYLLNNNLYYGNGEIVILNKI